ncbi:MAG: radical SAM protein [Candidatus Atribacteria bacterium]|nr:radical SAM protein [Candidatus Atribacteria bacterium]
MLKRLFNQKSTINNPQSGLYHYRRENINEKSRIHLRLDPDGHGTLIVNANRILHLNPTAALMAYFALEETSEQDAVRLIRQKYHVDAAQARADLGTVRGQIEELVRPDGACPIHELGLETVMPFSARPTAPYRLDLALTYRCNNDCAHCYNVEHPSLTSDPSPKDGSEERGVRAELSTGDWKRVLDKAWGLGIPHIIFTGGEPTMRADLPELVAHAEKNGQITGLNTNARRLSDPRYVEKLVAAGLDHVQITVESNDAEVHDRMVRTKGAFPQTVKGLKNALASPLYVMTNTTMLRTNAHTIPATLDFLADTGVPTVGLNALIYSGRGSVVGTGLAESELTPLLEVACQKTAARGQRLIWYTPTQYCGFDPMALDLGVKGCTAALYNMCVEPDGGVLPCQSYYHQLGNLLADDWDSIWNHDLAIRLRERQGLPEKCNGCSLLAECGGGCPLPRVPCENQDCFAGTGPTQFEKPIALEMVA